MNLQMRIESSVKVLKTTVYPGQILYLYIHLFSDLTGNSDSCNSVDSVERGLNFYCLALIYVCTNYFLMLLLRDIIVIISQVLDDKIERRFFVFLRSES